MKLSGGQLDDVDTLHVEVNDDRLDEVYILHVELANSKCILVDPLYKDYR